MARAETLKKMFLFHQGQAAAVVVVIEGGNRKGGEMEKTLNIQGMHCTSCAVKIENKLALVNGVSKVSVNFATGKAVVHGEVKEEELKRAIEDLGYKVESGGSVGDLREVR